MNRTGWTRGADGNWRAPSMFPGAVLTPAAFAALPDVFKSWPASGPGEGVQRLAWVAKHKPEANARIFGGAAADGYALRLITDHGVPVAEAIRRAQAITPADKPARFPKLAAAFAQAGRVEEARYLMNPAAFVAAATAGSTTTAHQAGTARAPATAHQLTTETAAAGVAALLALLLV